MKKLLSVITLVLFMGCGLAFAKDPQYEVTLKIVYNSIPVHEIANLMRDQLREHQDACKVEVQIKNVDIVQITSVSSRLTIQDIVDLNADTTATWEVITND